MPKFYATFGVQYSEVPHPVLSKPQLETDREQLT